MQSWNPPAPNTISVTVVTRWHQICSVQLLGRKNRNCPLLMNVQLPYVMVIRPRNEQTLKRGLQIWKWKRARNRWSQPCLTSYMFSCKLMRVRDIMGRHGILLSWLLALSMRFDIYNWRTAPGHGASQVECSSMETLLRITRKKLESFSKANWQPFIHKSHR